VRALQQADLAALQSYLARLGGAPVVISVLGDRRRVDLERLRSLGKFIEVKPADLFPYGRP
jgi:hypothetical protein